eukprot:1137615-Amphidinium_carterae.1
MTAVVAITGTARQLKSKSQIIKIFRTSSRFAVSLSKCSPNKSYDFTYFDNDSFWDCTLVCYGLVFRRARALGRTGHGRAASLFLALSAP